MNKEKIYKSFDIAFNDYLSNEKSKSNHWIAQNKNFLKKIKKVKLEDFRTYGRSDLVGKGRNLGLMDGIRKHQTTDEGFNKSIQYILETGNGLEQEFLLSMLNK